MKYSLVLFVMLGCFIAYCNDATLQRYQSAAHPLKGSQAGFFAEKVPTSINMFPVVKDDEHGKVYQVTGASARKMFGDLATKVEVFVTPNEHRLFGAKVYILVAQPCAARQLFDLFISRLIANKGMFDTQGLYAYSSISREENRAEVLYCDGAKVVVSIMNDKECVFEYWGCPAILKEDKTRPCIIEKKKRIMFDKFSFLGQSLGAEVDFSKVKVNKDNPAEADFVPQKKFLSYNKYSLSYTPIGKYIWKISAIAEFASNEEDKYYKVYNETKRLLSLKYNVDAEKINSKEKYENLGNEIMPVMAVSKEDCRFALLGDDRYIKLTLIKVDSTYPEIVKIPAFYIVMEVFDERIKKFATEELDDITREVNKKDLDAL